MTAIELEIPIARPPEDVWEVIRDFGGVERYNPNVVRARLTSAGPNGGVGATRRCELAFAGAAVDERIVEWTDGEGYALEMYGGTKLPPFAGAPRAELRIHAVDTRTVVLVGTLRYDLRFGPVGALMDAAMVRRRFSDAFARMLAGVKHRVETGGEVGDATDLRREIGALRPATPARLAAA